MDNYRARFKIRGKPLAISMLKAAMAMYTHGASNYWVAIKVAGIHYVCQGWTCLSGGAIQQRL